MDIFDGLWTLIGDVPQVMTLKDYLVLLVACVIVLYMFRLFLKLVGSLLGYR